MTVNLQKDTAMEGSVDPRFVLPNCPQFSCQDFQPVETFVSNAVAARDSNSKTYRAIIDSIRKAEDPHMLCKVLLALRGSTLHQLSGNPKGHAHLLHLLFRLDPFLKAEHPKLPGVHSLADAHLHLLLALVSANSVFLTPAMNALWRLLINEVDAPVERYVCVTAK
jgi:RNA polymerase I-specific transcription initiation factor RRN3